MKQLVEEIRLVWCEECADGPMRSEYDKEWDEACATGAEDLCRERARKVASLLLSAVHDGRLDEELGMVERGHINADGMLLDAHDAIRIWDLKEGDILIALRKEGQ